MKLEWLGEPRGTIDSIIYWSNLYAATYKKKFKISEDIYLSAAEIQVIEYLLENESLHLKMAEVAGRLGILKSAFTALTSGLEKQGLVKKQFRENNKKDMLVTVTEKGKAAYKIYSEGVSFAWQKPVLDKLEQIPEEYRKLFSEALVSMAEITGAIMYAKEPYIQIDGAQAILKEKFGEDFEEIFEKDPK